MGQVIYDGPSLLTGEHIIAIITGENGCPRTSNRKTGNMVQLWILVADLPPHKALSTKLVHAICGHCPLIGKLCYVNTSQAPLSIWRTWKRKGYRKATKASLAKALAGRKLRLGAYGDPRALPVGVLDQLVNLADGHTGYTHSWMLEGTVDAGYQRYLMASVGSEAQLREAHAAGWRTFRTRHEHEPVARGEITCPAAEEAGKRRTCETCLACDGASRPGQVSVTILYHGGKAVMNYAKKAAQAAA